MSSDSSNPRRLGPWGKPLPRFQSPQEEQTFWATHEVEDRRKTSATSSFPSNLAGCDVLAPFPPRDGPGLEVSSGQWSVLSLVRLEPPSVGALVLPWRHTSLPSDR